MKKIYLTAILLVFTFISYAQKKDSIRTDTLAYFVSPAETAKFPFLNIIPPSPEAAAFARVGELPVSLGSGTTSFSVPIHDIASGSLKVSVSLENHSSGIKVMDVATTVGTNWTLKGAGGVITRVVRGIPDEHQYGFRNVNVSTEPIGTDPNYEPLKCYLAKVALFAEADGESDLYYYNFGQMSGKFIFANRTGNNVSVTPLPVTLPHSALKIETNPTASSFTITDPEGNLYFFGTKETTQAYNRAPGSQLPAPTYSYTSAWYLDMMVSANRIDTIRFNYFSTTTIRGQSYRHTTLTTNNSTSTGVYAYSNNVARNDYNNQFISSINYKNGSVNFTYVRDREDVKDDLTYIGYRLTNISVNAKSDNTAGFERVKSFKLNQSYFACSDGNSMTDLNPNGVVNHSVNSYLRKRLKLESVTEYGTDDISYKPSTAFEYYEDNPLPIHAAMGQDYWGYSNGAVNLRNLLIADVEDGILPPTIANGANRTPNFAYAVSGALKKIYYPTGGRTEIIYEGNIDANAKHGGGIRVKSIANFNENGQATKKSYEYVGSYFTNFYNGDFNNLVTVYSSDRQTPNCLGVITDKQYPESLSFSLGTNSGSSLAYNEVVEYTENTAGDKNGKKVFTFTAQTDFTSSSYPYIEQTNEWNRGLPLTEKTYKKVGANYTLIAEKSNIYTSIPSPYYSKMYGARVTFTPGGCSAALLCNGRLNFSYEFTYIQDNTSVFVSVIDTTITKEYTPDGLNALTTTVKYEYDNTQTNLAVTKEKSWSSKGLELQKSYFYPHDFASNATYAEMVNRHIVSPVIQTIIYENNFQTLSERTNYKHWYSGTYFGNVLGFFAPESVEERLSGGIWFTKVMMGESLVNPIIEGFDTRARPVIYTLRDGTVTALTYYETVGKIDLLKTQTIGGGTNGSILTRTMEYDYKPLVGLTSMTDINGYTTTYQYDIFNRFKSVKDTEGNLLKDVIYHYANEENPTGIGATPTELMNYILTRTAREAQTGTELSSNVENSTTQIQYTDRLGRPIQSLIWKGTPDKTKDLISVSSEYNGFGVPYKSILPTPSDGVLGEFKSNAQSLASTFYSDTYPYNETIFEPSPLNRPEKQFGAGQAWRTANKYVNIQYLLAGSGILKFDVNTDGSVSCGLSYPLSSLFNTCTESERGIQTYELKDKQGRVTHKFQQMDAGFAVTAFCYNNLGQIYAVIPPEAYNKMGTGGTLISSFTESDEIFKEGIYGYRYDELGRQIEKHIPGAGWKYFVFDKHDREVAFADEQDQASGYWQFKKYDALGRIVQTGLLNGKGSTSRATLQAAFDGHSGLTYETTGTDLFGYTNVSFPVGYVPVEADVMSVSHYDNYDWQTETTYNFDAATAFHTQGLTKGLMTGMLSRNIETNDWLKVVNYFDYKGRLIQSWFKNHKGNTERSETQYRFNGEVLKIRIDHEGVNEISEYFYNHVGQKTSFRHTKDGTVKNVAKYEQDDIGRLKTKKLGSSELINSIASGSWNSTNIWQNSLLPTISDVIRINTGHEITINSGEAGSAGSLFNAGTLNTYGSLKLGVLPTNSVANDLQTVDYSYHIRGFRGINLDASDNPSLTGGKLFSFKLRYEEDNIHFDGNISSQTWLSAIDNLSRSYSYAYDGANRIKSGSFTGGKPNENYSLENMSYDFNGNIKTLWRKGMTQNNTFGYTDKLGYTYANNSNKLSSVSDAISGNINTGDFRDGNTSGDDYEYWADGSLKKDLNKGISEIQYNYLKLPKRIDFTNGKWVVYQYSADGNKLRKSTSEGITTDYLGNLIYENNVLYQLGHDEGRVVNGIYEYNISDHLGNVRIAFKDSLGIAKVVQAQDFEPFGLENWTSKLVNNSKISHFKYNSKETQIETGYIDLGNRSVDPTIGRMLSIDRFSEKYPNMSPFQFAGNNPIMYVDVNGDSINIAGLLSSTVHINAFRLFAGTKAGQSFLNNYASKGQKIYGEDGNVIYEAKSNGKYHKENTNLVYRVGNDEEGSTTNADFNKKGGMDINVNLAKKGFGTSNTTLNLVKTITHESFIHAETIALDIHDDKFMNLSSTPKEFRQFGNHADHYKVSSDYYSNQKNNGSLWPSQAQQVIGSAAKNLNMKMSGREIRSFMWYFNGSLIKINSKDGKVIYGPK